MTASFFTSQSAQKISAGEAIGHPKWAAFASRLSLTGLIKPTPD